MAKIDPDLVFDRLCKSAVGFLKESIDEIETKPKFALLHFCTSLELFLKARLLSEHWTLIITKNPTLQSFDSGDFHSVSPIEAIKRLENTVGEKIPDAAKSAFNSTVQHRNRVMHFYNDDEHEDLPKFRELVAGEVCLSIFHLERLLNSWSDIFDNYESDFIRVFYGVKRVQSFLSAKFDAIQSELTDRVKEGKKISKCESCGYRSAIEERFSSQVFESHCQVCNHVGGYVGVGCDNLDCDKEFVISGYQGFQLISCECGGQVDQKHLRDELETGYNFDPHDYYQGHNCVYCQNQYVVVQHENVYVCTECCAIDSSVAHCEYCGEAQMGGGNLDFSGIAGCEFCPGSKNWHSD